MTDTVLQLYVCYFQLSLHYVIRYGKAIWFGNKYRKMIDSLLCIYIYIYIYI